jgi:hypothetical protein
MTSKPVKRVCRVAKYLEKEYPKFYELLEDYQVQQALIPRRSHAGVTVIIPTEESLAKLNKMRFGNDCDVAIDILLSYIIQDYLKSPLDWNQRKSDIPNSLEKKLEIKEIRGSKITLIDGTEIEPDTKFINLAEEENNYAVYRAVKGEIDPSKYNKDATFEYAKSSGKNKKPSMQRNTESASQSKFVKILQDSMCFELLKRNKSKMGSAQAPFNFLINFHNFVMNNGDESAKFFSLLIHSCFTPFTNTYFSFGNPLLFTVLGDFNNALQTDEKLAAEYSYKKGRDDYLKLCKTNFDLLRLKITGGSVAKPSLKTLQKAISDAYLAHEAALLGKTKEMAQHFTSLCWARNIEATTLVDLKKNPSDCKSDISDMCEILKDRSSGELMRIAEGVSLQGMLTSILEAAQQFNESAYSCFPFKGESSQLCFTETAKLLIGFYDDDSLAKSLKKMPAEELTRMLAQDNE